MTRVRWPLVLAGCLLFAGCATPPPAKLAFNGDPLVDGENAIQNGPPRDRVLWEYRTALIAMRQGKYDIARRDLESAVARLMNLYGPDKSAKEARNLFKAEARKSFLGEPYALPGTRLMGCRGEWWACWWWGPDVPGSYFS